MNANLHNAAIFFDRVTRLDIEDWHDAFFQEAIESGGTYLLPQPAHANTDARPSHLVEIHLHGLTAFGADEAEAIASWIKLAERTTGSTQ